MACFVLAATSLVSGPSPLLGVSGPSPLLGRRDLCRVAGSVLAGSALAASCAHPAMAAIRAYSAADASDAVRRIKGARGSLENVRVAVSAKRFDDATELLSGTSALALVMDDITVLVQSSVLRPDDKIAIGSKRRYGVGADVLIMLGGLTNAASEEDGPGALSFATKAASAIDEILAIAAPYNL
jgi:ATP-dependent protease HslVU (ClpYQ) peptidase subunit